MTEKEANAMRRLLAETLARVAILEELNRAQEDGGAALTILWSRLEARITELEARQEAETDLAEEKELMVHDLKREVAILRHQLSHGSAYVQLNKEGRN